MKIPPKEANLFLKSDICKEFEWLVLELDKYKNILKNYHYSINCF